MRSTSTLRSAVLLVAPFVASALALAGAPACSSGDTGRIKLTVGLFAGNFGFKPLYEEFRRSHPDIEIVERAVELADHHRNLAAHLATNTGAADIEAIEEGFIAQFIAQPAKFHNLLDHGAGQHRNQWLDWKWEQALSADASTLIGLGTDVGGLAICYRTDLFAMADLPTARDEVAGLWPDWPSYLATGRRFVDAKLPGTHWFDGAGNVFNAIVGQAQTGYYDRSNRIVAGSNPDIRRAWDLAVAGIRAGQSGKLAPFSPDWNIGFSKGSFATITCPAWMTGYVQQQARDSAGRWDIAAIPGGGGNWGGTHLTLPKQGRHPEQAYELVRFLTAPEQQAKVFRHVGNFPSTPSLYDDPTVVNFTNPFFSNAPVGRIFTAAARNLRPQYQGPRAGEVEIAFGNALTRVEQGGQRPDQAWNQALEEIGRLG